MERFLFVFILPFFCFFTSFFGGDIPAALFWMARQEPWISLFYRLKEFMKHPVTDLSALVSRVFARCAKVNSSPHARPGHFFDGLGKAVIRPRRAAGGRGGRKTEA